MSNFEVIDRRGQNKPMVEPKLETEQPSNVVTMPAHSGKRKRQWEDVRYILSFAPQQNGTIIIICRAVGKRDDGFPFVADYLSPQEYAPEFLWQPKAKDRLDTFLDCDCVPRAMCSVHKMYIPQWTQQDVQRLTLEQSGPVPPAIEAYFTAEQAAQTSNIHTPR